MINTRIRSVLHVILFIILFAGCAPKTPPDLVAETPAAPTSAPLPAPTSPTPAATQPRAAPALILGRPTADAVSVSLLSALEQQVSIAYGTQPGSYAFRTGSIRLQADVPQTVELTGLLPDTQYYYTVLCDGAPTGEHRFHTQRAPGSSFVFTIDADPHSRDPRFNGQLYAITLANALEDQPDFHIDLGDTFMTEKFRIQTYAEAESTFTDMRPYFAIIGPDAPLFLVNGNHEGELGWPLTGNNDPGLPVWSTQLRQAYYPNPLPNAFYSGSTSLDPLLGAARDGYYAWTWGDALFVVLDPFWYTADKPNREDLDSSWNWTLGKEQYDWLRATLEGSDATFKFVFTHHLVGGGPEGRGGIEFANLYEWGGDNAEGSYGFDQQRPGWGMPIHQLLVENGVSAVFHGHDHVFVQQELDGIIYQEVPQPSITDYGNTRMAAEYGYVNGVVLGSSGHLRLTVTPQQVTVDYVRAYLPQDEKPNQRNGQVDYSYEITP